MALILKNVRLSNRPEYEKIECFDGVNGFANITIKSKTPFVTLEFQDTLTKVSAIRRYFQKSPTNQKWDGLSPAELAKLIGKEIPGTIQSREGFTTVIFAYEMSEEKTNKVFNSEAYLGMDLPEGIKK